MTYEPNFHVPDNPEQDEVEDLLSSLPVPEWKTQAIRGDAAGDFLGTCTFTGRFTQGKKFIVDGIMFEARVVQHDPGTGCYFVVGRKL